MCPYTSTFVSGDLTSLARAAGGNSGSSAAGADKSGAQGRRNISEHELHKKTDKDINLQVAATTTTTTFFFFSSFLLFFLFIHFFVIAKNISIHSHNYIIYFNDKSGGEL